MLDKIGALWRSTSAHPKAPFASGEIDFMGHKLRVVLWNNNKRPDKRDPDFTVTLDKPREQDAPKQERAPQQKAQVWDHGENKPAPNDFTDDIPF
jgi:hypothetical protein